ncbi:MAG: aminopeptidase [Chitinophagaceae bacterium]|nr:aminopeptidase [Polaromonas sp.]
MRWLLIVMAGLCLSGCSTAAYYWQSVHGHMQMLNAARPVDDVLADQQTPAALKARLMGSQRIRSFAATALKLPDNASYKRYVALARSAVVWNVVAAPELSLTLKTWCFPVVGCVGYRGYFSEADAQHMAEHLKSDALEVTVYGVPAYSTLGKMAWLGEFGSDPLLSTFIGYPEGELARLIFHELAHQVVYAPGDTMFNESFATAVERLGGQLWLSSQASPAAQHDYAKFDQRRQSFRALTLNTRSELKAIYAISQPSDHDEENKPSAGVLHAQPAIKLDKSAQQQSKAAAMQRFKTRYAQLKTTWQDGPPTSGYDTWVAKANNASFGAQAAYDELVPGFEKLFEAQGRDWQRFYDAVNHLASLPQKERHAALQ